jgi:AcrR family transcriptional regulator
MSTHSPRDRMIRSAALLMRERGVEATSFSDVLAHSGAPRGSIYHHFPHGKAELIEEATRWAGDFIATGERVTLEANDPVAALDVITDYWRSVLRDSEFAAGCPIAAATVEGDRVPAAREAAGDVFRRWETPYADALERNGIPARRARSVATLVISALEGAIILARAQRSIAPLERVADELHTLVSDALGRVRPK